MITGLRGIIPGWVSIQDFAAVTKFDDNLSKDILEELMSLGIGKRQGQQYLFEEGDRLKTAIELLKHGNPTDQVSEALNWKDFEGMVAEILSSKDFAVIKNLTLTKPRMEIDVVGMRLGVAMLIDCKHWKRYSRSALATAVAKQVKRTMHYVSKTSGAIAVPAIVTLYKDSVSFIDGVPVVPVFQFSSFVDELYGNLDNVRTIETSQ